MELSLIIPCHNEEGNVEAFAEAATACFDELQLPYELVFVDDGSSDGTLAKLRELVVSIPEQHPFATVKEISFSRNFGKEAALLAGLKNSTGDFVGFIDADMQQDPAISRQMYSYLKENPDCDCVAAVQQDRHESIPLKMFKGMFYRLFNIVSETEITANASDFRVFRRKVADALAGMPEHFRFSKGLFSWVGFAPHVITYKANERLSGTSKWSFRKLLGYALGGMVSFSMWPLRLTLYLGLIACVAAVAYLIFTLVESVVFGIITPGYPTIVCLILMFGGILMLMLGVFGEYLGRVYIEGKRRPLYIEREVRSSSDR